MQFVKERLGKWITAAIVLVVGILCIVAGAAMHGQDGEAAGNALKAISLVLGIILIIVGALALVMSIVAVLAKKGFAAVAIPGAILVAVGISLVAQPYAAELIALFLTILPYLLLCVGAVILGDAIFNLVMGIKAKNVKGVLVGVIVEFVVAAVAITMGALCVGADSVIPGATQLIIFGIIVCLAACLLVVLTFIKMPDVVVAVVTKKEEKAEEPKEEPKEEK